MFWHFRHAQDCERCEYWDDVYRMHLANVSLSAESDVTDEEMLAAAETMELDASD